MLSRQLLQQLAGGNLQEANTQKKVKTFSKRTTVAKQENIEPQTPVTPATPATPATATRTALAAMSNEAEVSALVLKLIEKEANLRIEKKMSALDELEQLILNTQANSNDKLKFTFPLVYEETLAQDMSSVFDVAVSAKNEKQLFTHHSFEDEVNDAFQQWNDLQHL